MGIRKILLKNFAKKNFAKKFFFQSEHVSSQIWCQKFFLLLVGVGGGPPKKSCSEWAETHFGFGIFEIRWFPGGRGGPSVRYKHTDNQPTRHTDTRHSDQISRSARRDGATNKTVLLQGRKRRTARRVANTRSPVLPQSWGLPLS